MLAMVMVLCRCERFNGQEIHNLKQLAEAVDGCQYVPSCLAASSALHPCAFLTNAAVVASCDLAAS